MKTFNIIKSLAILPLLFLMSGCGNIGASNSSAVSLSGLSSVTTSTSNENSGTSLSLSLSSTTMTPGGSIELFASGGSGSYIYAIYQGSGSINGTIYTAPATSTTAVLEVVDSSGNKAYASVVISTTSPSPTPTSSGLLTLKSQQVYTNASITMVASGGDGIYQYSLQGGGGTLTGSSYLAPSYPTTAQIQVVDNAGNTATTTIEVTSSGFLTNGAELYAENDLFITFNMPIDTGALYPSFAIGGAGSNHVFGYNYNEMTETTYFAPGAGSAAVAITNYDINNTSPYTGTLNMLGQAGGSASAQFCFMPGSNFAYFMPAEGLATTVGNIGVSYGANATGVSGGSNIQGIWFDNINTATQLETAQVWVSGGRHNLSLTDCSTYTSFYMTSSSLY